MLRAILGSKAGRIRLTEGEVTVSWREVFRRSEDLLTAVFFGRLPYLSDAGFSWVMGKLLGEHAAALGALEDMEFWPNLRGLEGRSYVQPDVLLNFEQATVLVEVKPPFGGVQLLHQCQDQVHGFVAECMSGDRPAKEIVHFLALGNNYLRSQLTPDTFDTRGCFELVVHTREWKPLVAAVHEWSSESSRSDQAIIADWIAAFALFGMRPQPVRHWHELTGWAEDIVLSLNTMQVWPLLSKKTQVRDKPDRTLSWADLIDFTNQYSRELESWN